jgi:2-polyprenyl-3-methyl-5-hydroxy-6-metoxy-1,4-benzoquinol methylase
MKCLFCRSKKKIKFNSLPLFRHLDFKTIHKNSKYLICKRCGHLSTNVIKKNQFLKTSQYANSNQTNKKIFVKNQLVKDRIYYQNKIIKKIVNKKKKLNFLDIGCFDGLLLKKLSQNYKNSKFYGLDNNKYLKNKFPKKSNFFFILNIDELNEKKFFDIIILSHSIMYIEKLDKILNVLKSKLKDNGRIIIHTPNYERNPFYYLMSDNFHFIDTKNIQNIFSIFNLSVTKIKKNYLQNENVYIAKKTNKKLKIKKIKNSYYENLFRKITKTKNKINKIKSNNIVVKGTTIKSAFVDHFLKSKVLFFIDDDKNKIGQRFRSKKILSVSKKKINKKNMFLIDTTKDFTWNI